MASSDTKEFSHSNTRLASSMHPIRLQNIQPQDAAGFAQVIAADNGKPPMDLDRARASIERINGNAATPSVLSTADGKRLSGPGSVNLLVVESKDGGAEGEYEVIGLSGFGAIKTLEKDGKKVSAGDAGVVLVSKYRGKGYAVEAMKLSIDWALRSLEEGGLQLDLVTITTRSDNEAMTRLTDEKLGLKGKSIIRDGEFSDKEIYWEITPQEWQALGA
ncbi:acetyltransferase [Sarocladium strictum]